jgi:type I restriction enzyme S subunit
MREGYKDSELGEIPKSWEVVELGNEIEIKHGYAFIGSGFTQEENENILLSPGNFESNGGIKFDWKKQKYFRGTVPHEFVLKENDLLVAMTDLTKSCVILGSPAIIPDSEFNYLHNQRLGLINIINNQRLTKTYLFHYFNYSIYRDYLRSCATGTTVSHTSPKTIYQVKLLLPPLKEQQKIAEILNTVDDKIELIDQQIAQAQSLKKGLMQRLLTKGIGHTEFKDSPLGEIPKSWEVVKVEDISNTITKGASPKWQGYEYQSSGMLFVTSENVRDGLLDISKPKFLPLEFNQKVKKSRLKNGDILINIVGASIGRSCMYNSDFEFANINQAICLLRIESPLLSKYILYYLQGEETIKRLLDAQNGSARQNLSLTDIRKFKFAIPPEEEQSKAIEIFNSISEKLEVLSEKKGQTQWLKKGLMQQLLTGRVRI